MVKGFTEKSKEGREKSKMYMTVIEGSVCFVVPEGTEGSFYYCGSWYIKERSAAGNKYYQKILREGRKEK